MDIETVKSTQNKYHLVSREFDIAELKLLIDAVESSKFISAKKSEQLVAKISKFAGSHKGNELKRNIFPEGRIKPVNEQILLIVDAVNEAINSNKKIAFQYYQYNVRKEKKVKNDGDQYVFSPYYLVWNGDYYYMVGYSDKHKNIGSFRIDRICKQPRVLGTDAVPKPEDFDINEYLNTMFRMIDNFCISAHAGIDVSFKINAIGVGANRIVPAIYCGTLQCQSLADRSALRVRNPVVYIKGRFRLRLWFSLNRWDR